MKVLFTTPVLEHPAAGGAQLRIENSIKALSTLCELHIVSRQPQHLIGGEAAENYFRKLSRSFTYSPSSSGLSQNRYIRKAQTETRRLSQTSLRQDSDFLVSLVRRLSINVLWFGFGNISFPLIKKIKAVLPELKVVCDTDSVWSRFILRELPYQKSILRKAVILQRGRRSEKEEREWVNLCEVTTAVSPVDAEYYRSFALDPKKVMLFSNGIDLDNYKTCSPMPANFKKPCIYLAGVFGRYHSPMDMAARWVLNEVFPLVQAAVPNVHFYIAGRESDRMLGHWQDTSITVTGKLPSVLPYLSNADVAIVPLKFESGTRFKILEAGACKIPLVSTTLGAEGIPVIDGEHILIADEPEDFANAIVRLLNEKDFANKLALNCHKLVHECYSIKSLTVEAKRILDYLDHA